MLKFFLIACHCIFAVINFLPLLQAFAVFKGSQLEMVTLNTGSRATMVTGSSLRTLDAPFSWIVVLSVLLVFLPGFVALSVWWARGAKIKDLPDKYPDEPAFYALREQQRQSIIMATALRKGSPMFIHIGIIGICLYLNGLF